MVTKPFLEWSARGKLNFHIANMREPLRGLRKKTDPVEDPGSQEVTPAQHDGDVRTFHYCLLRVGLLTIHFAFLKRDLSKVVGSS
jgi:hypothetical protein